MHIVVVVMVVVDIAWFDHMSDITGLIPHASSSEAQILEVQLLLIKADARPSKGIAMAISTYVSAESTNVSSALCYRGLLIYSK